MRRTVVRGDRVFALEKTPLNHHLPMNNTDVLRRIFAIIVLDEWEPEQRKHRRTRFQEVCKLWLRVGRELADAAARSIDDAEVQEFFRMKNWRTRNAWYRAPLGQSAIFPKYERLSIAADDAWDLEDQSIARVRWISPTPTPRSTRYADRCLRKRIRHGIFADEVDKTLEFIRNYEDDFEKRTQSISKGCMKAFYTRIAYG
jgi:hypothetical protein